MPVGRYRARRAWRGPRLWPASDALCAALQVINHLQDCGKDYRTLDRVYIPPTCSPRPAHGSRISARDRRHARRCARRSSRWPRGPSAARDSRAGFAAHDPRPAAGRRSRGDPAPRGSLTRPAATRDPLSERVHHGQVGGARLLAAWRCGRPGRARGMNPASRPPPLADAGLGQLLLCRHARAAQGRARGDVRDLCLLPRWSTTSPTTSRATAPAARPRSTQWRADLDALYAGGDPGQAAFWSPRRSGAFGLDRADFQAVIDGMAMDVDARHPLAADRPSSISIATASPRRSGGCR